MILQIDHKNGKEVNAAQSLSEIHKNNSTLARYPTLSTMDCVAISRHTPSWLATIKEEHDNSAYIKELIRLDKGELDQKCLNGKACDLIRVESKGRISLESKFEPMIFIIKEFHDSTREEVLITSKRIRAILY